MWIDISNFKAKNVIFLNVEHLTEQHRMNQAVNIIRNGVSFADFSLVNIKILKMYAAENNICIKNISFYHLPYQFNLNEQVRLSKETNDFEYDVGIINAIPKIDGNIENIRTTLWNKLIKTDIKVKNIIGWNQERDDQINKCKIILNIHNFECFFIFEHVRCDRLIFANKLIVSQLSYEQEKLDIFNNVIWLNNDEHINDNIKFILENYEELKTKYIDKTRLTEIMINRKVELLNTINNMMINISL
tara:strand:- start:1996 stop:2733 length:738 start_codon:yes stop_codon:yes gene_type:complete